MNKQSLIAALEAEDKRSVKDMCSLAYRSGLRFALSLANQLDEPITFSKIAFTCERTGKRWEFDNIAKLSEAFLITQKQLDENAGVDAGIKSDFSAIWDAVEKVESKLHDKYHFHLPAVKKALADAHRMFRPLWDKLNSPQNLTFLDDERLVEEVARAIKNAPVERVVTSQTRAFYGCTPGAKDGTITEEKVEFITTDESRAKAAIATIKRLAQSKATTEGNVDGL